MKIESYRRGFAYSSALSVLDQLLAFLPNALIAFLYGARAETDLYFFCLAAIAVITTFAGNLNSSVLIPESMRIETERGSAAAHRYLFAFLYAYAAIGLLLGWAAWLHPVAVFGVISRFTGDLLDTQVTLLRLAACVLPMQLCANLMNDILYSRKYFTMPMLASCGNRVLVILGTLLLHRELGVASLMAGWTAAFALQLVILNRMLARGLGWRTWIRPSSPDASTWRRLRLACGGGLLSALSGYVAAYLMSGLQAGAFTAIHLAMRLLALPTNMITTQASSIIGIRFNELSATRDQARLAEFFVQASRALFGVLSLLGVCFVVLSEYVVALLFQRGGFDVNAAADVSAATAILAIALPFVGLNTLAARLFMAEQRLGFALAYQACTTAVYVGAIAWSIHRYGPAGYVWTYTLFYAVNAFMLFPLLRLCFPWLRYGRVLGSLPRLLLIALLAGAAGHAALSLAQGWTALAALIVGCGVIGAAYAALSLPLGLARDLRALLPNKTA
ncbi:MAG TPA: lipid II flippase MurJ [Kiritimatiellia bacterium]|nr:lipid II flippase MurJ [Kiritimatiellia bacterium]